MFAISSSPFTAENLFQIGLSCSESSVIEVVVMADRRDWGGGGDDPEELTQRMIERIWESLTDIRMRMDQQAPVPPVVGEGVPVAPVPPQPGVEVPFVAPVPPSPPVIVAEEPVVQIERESGRSRGNAGRSLHSAFFAKVVLVSSALALVALWEAHVGCPKFSVSQAVSSGLCPGTCAVPSRSVSSDLDTLTPYFELYVRLRERRHIVYCFRYLCLVCSVLGEFPTEPVTNEDHPYSPQARARMRFLYRRPVRSRDVAVLAQRL
ncbi:hypothetical protein Taro_027500 [Colocasia esculenta]|uniref:Uncharacterized protein n=1 Tax=Colocasia esculenta TaxID=4460 RepID=A0A843VRQ5_COLES|nr:hypothetical protein [Colocasia esculenta]